VRLGLAAAIFWVAYDGGSYGVAARSSIAIAVWWTLGVGLASGVLPRQRPSASALVVGGALGGLAVLTASSILWSSGAERPFLEADRVVLYVGVFALAAASATPSLVRRAADGLALGVTAVAAVALVSRCFPDTFATGQLPRFLPSAAARLSFPVDYWNGLAVLVALAVPALLQAAISAARSPVLRGLAVAPLPAFAAVVYLASSRGGTLTAAVAVLVFLLLSRRAEALVGALAVAAVGSGVALAVLAARDELVDGPLASAAASSQGRSAALLLAATCLGTGAAYAGGLALLPPVRLSRTAWRAAAGAALAAIALAVVLSHPVRRVHAFTRPPSEFQQPRPDYVRAHLLSGGGSGRWQFWGSALDEFEAHPLGGGGAGSYEAWWAAQGNLPTFVRDAHSLYVETLGELGVLGLALLLAAVGGGLAGAVAAVRRAGIERAPPASLAAVFAGFAFAAGVDWMWELTAVGAVAVAALGLVLGLGGRSPAPRLRPVLRALAAAVCALVLACEALPLLTETALDRSRQAVRRGDGDEALAQARRARDLEPWAASTWLQLALVEEQAGQLRDAARHVGEALDRDRGDWRLWLVSARLHTKLGEIPAARAALARAIALNPRSPLFANVSS
jgi:hypothetical protein